MKTLTSELKELFKDIETQLHEKKTMILSDILCNEEKELAVIADVRKEMEQKRDQAEQNLQALQKLKEQPDVFLFLKVSSGILLFLMFLSQVTFLKITLMIFPFFFFPFLFSFSLQYSW